ncbi:LysR family transcriptional regulator [Caballeronia sp. 15715]|uniref:LysR family transcriptional regulator n=1 Tax=Caballeronia sp. 15715 TaxID=3391030 RepID=UPI0039E4561E
MKPYPQSDFSEILGLEEIGLDMWIDPPIKHSLHLNALRAFEAAARLGGFVQAASELHVTPGAIASQIKSLEGQYGAPLFERHANGVALSALGESVRMEFTVAFDAIEAAARNLRRLSAPQRVHIVTSPALAELWLGPRLPRLTELLDPIDISITAVDEPPNLKRSPYDVCLFYTEKLSRGQRKVLSEEVLPVCTPRIAGRLRDPADLENIRCIADVGWDDWAVWAGAVMPHRSFTARGPGFSLYAIAVQQALLGAGVLIGRRSLVQRYLDSGALVAPFDVSVPLGLTISAWTHAESKGDAAIGAVTDSLIDLG